MAKRSENRDKAFEIYIEKQGNIKPKEIADMLNENVANIRVWKSKDSWDEKIGIKKNKRGAPKGNNNAVGNKGGGAPKGNLNAFKHGKRIPEERFLSKKFLSKYLPKVTQNIIQEIQESGMNTLDILWTNIEIQFAAIIRSQKIMHVKSKSEMIKELRKSKNKSKTRDTEKTSTNEDEEEFEYEFQFAWDRQSTFLTSQSKALVALQGLISKYEELLHKNWDYATEEQKLRVEKLKKEISKMSTDYESIPVVISGGDELED